MNDKPKIDIRYSSASGPNLIILVNSGVEYTNQTGGLACLSPIEEGVFVPLYDELDNQEEKLIQYFTEIKYESTCMNGIDEDDAVYIDRLLSSGQYTKHLSVDRDKLQSSHEAWIYVNVDSPSGIEYFHYSGVVSTKEEIDLTCSPLYGFKGYKGVLTWENSD